MIQINNITKIHKRGETDIHALRGVSCDIPSGSFTFVVGPSGSGKSTLLYLIGALDEPTGGEIIVNGQSLFHLSSKQRDEYRRLKIGFVFQSFNLLTNLTAVENVLIPYMPRGISTELRRNAVELLERVGLGDRLEHRPNQLSGGEQQRVAIARALLKKPAVVLADEPTGELDSENGLEIFRHLRSLNQEQKTTVIVVTHDQQYLTEDDHVLKLRDGQLENEETEDVTVLGETA
jgi:putative ABC transport system ATP-binding protein